MPCASWFLKFETARVLKQYLEVEPNIVGHHLHESLVAQYVAQGGHLCAAMEIRPSNKTRK
jgi:hypothetical protein